MQIATVDSSTLAQTILGSWAQAPKKARDDYEHFLRAGCYNLGDGEASTEELAGGVGSQLYIFFPTL